MADTLAAYYRASLEDYNRAHGLSDQSQTISNQRKVVTEFLHSSKELSRFRVLEFIDDTDILGLKSELQQRSASLVQFLCAERRKTNEKRGEKTDGKWAGPVEGTARFNSRKP